MEINELDIDNIIKQVLANIAPALMDKPVVKTYLPDNQIVGIVASNRIKYGIFETVDEAVEAADKAQQVYSKEYPLKDRDKLITALRTELTLEVNTLAKMTYDETGLGKYEDKVKKNLLAINKTPGIEILKTEAISGDEGLTIIEHAPFGVIGAVTPVTNPTETIINNVISMLTAGNSVVFNVHPGTKKSCTYLVERINQMIEVAGGPLNLVTMVKEPTMDSVKLLSTHPKIRMMVGTGGMGMVRSLLQSGKKVIGAGAGNPPVIVDKTANIRTAATEIFMGASFDNNILCIAEKEVFVEKEVYADFIYYMVEAGAFLLTNAHLQQIMDLVLTHDSSGYHVAKNWVGKDARKILEAIGVVDNSDYKLLICEVAHNHPFVMLEQLMPVLPIVKCDNLTEAIDYALIAEQGNRHTASMFSQSIDNLTAFARKVETTVFVKNASTLAGVGFGGEGHTTMTIAGPTGEGITNAMSFTRQRRCVLGDGGFRII
ncbi:MAG: aldehyde dehydrogenase EutE [Epulopiscium sp. Nele67-Bin002]|nr:MAG: aldehyde dehydrogenase EutE [Epulopiscium sp. Nele67-Bin002]